MFFHNDTFLFSLYTVHYDKKYSVSQYVRRFQIEKNFSRVFTVHMKKGSTTETDILMQSTSNRIHGNRGEKMKSVQIIQRCEWGIFFCVEKRWWKAGMGSDVWEYIIHMVNVHSPINEVIKLHYFSGVSLFNVPLEVGEWNFF